MNNRYHQSKEELQQEAEILQRCKKDCSNFELIYDKYYPQILNFIYLRVDDKQTAYDLAHQTFYKALKKIDQYEYKGLPYSSYLYRIAQNELNSLFRSNKKSRSVDLSEKHINQLQEEIPDENLIERIHLLKQGIKQLLEADIRIIEMRFFESRPFAEIADILGITENNAKVKTYRILDKLRVTLKS